MPERTAAQDRDTSPHERIAWGALLVVLCLWAAWRMGAFDLTSTVSLAGEEVDVTNTYAAVDHPFHATRADTLLESLKDGEILRWVGNHQGGYPVEFYPLGIAWLDVGIWALLLGSVPIIAVHKLAVIVVFLLPAVGFWILTRGDRLHPGTAVLATAIHLAVPGHWLNGGYTELVGWGLVTNVAGGSLALIAGGALARFVLNHERGMGLLAILAALAGALTNPRSLFAVVIVALAVAIAAGAGGPRRDARTRLVDAAGRIALVGAIASLIAAPVLLALMRYQEHYFFLHYEFYDPISQYLAASAEAATPVVVVLAIAGAVMPWLRTRMSVLRALSLAFSAYVLFTIWVATSSWAPPLVEQLEAPRLMPFQRQLMIYLGAAILVYLIQRLTARLAGAWPVLIRGVAIGALGLAVLVGFVRPLGIVPEAYRGVTQAAVPVPEMLQSLSPASTTGNPDLAQFQQAVRAAETVRVPGTSMFVVGNRDDWWHQQLWAPTETDAPLYYDDWLWYWTTTHKGPYDYRNGHYFPNPTFALTSEYLGENGVSVVIVTDMWVPDGIPPRQAARSVPELVYETTVGGWDIYRVRQPTSLITNGETLPAEISVDNHRVRARFEDGDGTVVVRRNWFPRWEATVKGEDVDIIARADGYMELAVPPGPVDIELRYVVTAADWVGRAASVVGVISLTGLVVTGGRIDRWWCGKLGPGTGRHSRKPGTDEAEGP